MDKGSQEYNQVKGTVETNAPNGKIKGLVSGAGLGLRLMNLEKWFKRLMIKNMPFK